MAYNTSHVDPPNEPIHNHRTQLTYVTAYRCDILISFGVLCTVLFVVLPFDTNTHTHTETLSRKKRQPENGMQNSQHRNMSPWTEHKNKLHEAPEVFSCSFVGRCVTSSFLAKSRCLMLNQVLLVPSSSIVIFEHLYTIANENAFSYKSVDSFFRCVFFSSLSVFMFALQMHLNVFTSHSVICHFCALSQWIMCSIVNPQPVHLFM